MNIDDELIQSTLDLHRLKVGYGTKLQFLARVII